MNTQLTLTYPLWFLIFCIIGGAIYAFGLYYRERSFTESPSVRFPLAVLRFLSVGIIILLLLGPLLRSLIQETKKPIVVLAQDNSESVRAELSDEAAARYAADIKALSEKLSEKYELASYSFGEEVREGLELTFTDKSSNLSDMLKEVNDLYSNQNLGAIILATDGIYNVGSNPVYEGTKINAPIYTIALGDTTQRRDLLVKQVFHNKITYLGDRFSVQVDIAALNCKGQAAKLTVYKVGTKNTRIKEFSININRKDFFKTQEIILDADKSGVQRYRFSLTAIENEASLNNNSKDIFVDVLDARQKILIAANSPHPDVAALKRTLSRNKNYEIDLVFMNNLKVNVADYNFVILHQVSAAGTAADALLTQLNAKNIPRLFIIGDQSNMNKFSGLQELVKITSKQQASNEVSAIVNNDFKLFSLPQNLATDIKKFPPINAPFGDYKVDPESKVLLSQQIGSVKTEYPLILFKEERSLRSAVICGEGIWKWRMFDYLQHENHDLFDAFMGKLIQYLTVKEDKRKFRVNVSKNIYNENEPIIFNAELYNASYELINETDANLIVTNEAGENFNFTFNKTTNAYHLNASFFPPGNYSYKGSCSFAGTLMTHEGKFSVQPIQLESYSTTADHNLLRLLSNKYGGQLIPPLALASLADSLHNKSELKPVLYSTQKTRPVINLKWIFFILMLLLSLEWFGRRYFGSY